MIVFLAISCSLDLECVPKSKPHITSTRLHPGPFAMPSSVLRTYRVQTLLAGSEPSAFLGISEFQWV